MAAPRTSWVRAEAAVVTVRVDGGRRQEVVLAGGSEPIEYLRCLGRLARGRHVLALQHDGRASVPSAARPDVLRVRTGCVGEADPSAGVWESAPILHYREDAGAPGAIATDTPLLLFYRRLGGPSGAQEVEYHVVFSHEDGGTDLTGLLARWGHTTDIEWIYRVDALRPASNGTYQGRDHRTVPFRGTRAWGAHPVLQIVGRHGMVTQRIHGVRRLALAPALAQPPREPREGVLHRFPWIYRVSALEVLRQVRIEATATPCSQAPADPRSYLFLQWTRQEAGARLEAGVRIGGRWYASAWGRPDLAFYGDDAESTAVKLPQATADAALEAIGVRALAPLRAPIELTLVRAFRLDDAYLPRRALAARGVVRVGRAGAWALAWERPARARTDSDR